jgi:CheY-like chemotaxis protein
MSSTQSIAKSAPPEAVVILLVEGNALTRMAVASYLRECGYQVVEADGGTEARRLLEAGTAARVAFIDLDLKGETDGFSLAQWIRAERPEVKVLLTSGVRRTAETASDLCEDGPHLSRPYDHRDLESHIRRLLAT